VLDQNLHGSIDAILTQLPKDQPNGKDRPGAAVCVAGKAETKQHFVFAALIPALSDASAHVTAMTVLLLLLLLHAGSALLSRWRAMHFSKQLCCIRT